MTVKLYEGCFVVTRGGEGDPPRAEGPITHDPSNQWPAQPFVCRGRRWSEDGTRAYGYAAGDIIAVFPTHEEAEAHLAGEKLEEIPKFPEVGSSFDFRRQDGTWIKVCVVPDATSVPQPVTWPDGVESMTTGYEAKVRVAGGKIHIAGGRGFSAADALHLVALLLAAADYVDGGEG